MKKILLSSLLSFILFFSISISAQAAIDGNLKVTSPNGGESYKEGDTVTITWDASSNIDKMMLGYSFGPGSLNWIATSIPNTGSYTWKVDVGNTTKTQVMISLTGYETGKGSLSDKSDGYFSVAQSGQQPPPQEPSKPAPTAPPTNDGSNNTSSLPTPPPAPTAPPIIIQNNWLSITNIEIWNIFYFEGSNTTDLSEVEDKTAVENFTLDTQVGFEFMFLDTLDFTKQNNLKAVRDIEEYWVVEAWFVWIKWEWFVEYKIETPIAVKYEDETLTEFAPVVTLENKDGEKKQQEVLGSTSGEVKVEVEEGGKIEISPRVELEGEAREKTNYDGFNLSGRSSHKDLDLMLTFNGIENEVNFNKFDDKTGQFEVKMTGFVKGANQVKLSYKDKEGELVEIGEKVVIFEPSFLSIYGKYLLLIIVAIISAGAGFHGKGLIKKYTSVRKEVMKSLKKFKKTKGNKKARK
jgi:hypothetical protein